ncbi:MAG: TonB family protein [Gammaproteobacteria bacterium]
MSYAAYEIMNNPNYRRFELPWSHDVEEHTRLRKITIGVMGTLLVCSALIPFLPVSDIDRNAATDIPPRLAKLVIEKKALPPPPPPEPKEPEVVKQEVAKPKPKPKPVPPPEVKPPPKVAKVIKPPPKPVVRPEPVTPQPTREEVVQEARNKAKTVGLMAVADDLADLRQNSAVQNTSGRNLSASVSEGNVTERSLITSKSGTRTAGVKTSDLSRSTGGGGLAGRTTTAVAAPAYAASNGSSSASSSGSGSNFAGQRSQDEIETVFDKNKAAIYALYRRALRKDPTLQGKLVLELTIAPSGKVVSVSVVSSQLGSSDFEKSLLRRVRMFDFGAQDVDEVTTTKPIDFFPA